MSDTISETAGKVVWFEVPARDTERARSFYGGLFGWEYEAYEGQDYHLAGEAGGAIDGSPGHTGMLVYFGTNDLEGSLARVRELGGESGEPRKIPGIGVYAHCTDLEGNAFGLYQGGGS